VAPELGLQPSNASTAIRLLIARSTPERRQDSADARLARLFPTAAAYTARDRREQSWGEQLAAPYWTGCPPLTASGSPPPYAPSGSSPPSWRRTRQREGARRPSGPPRRAVASLIVNPLRLPNAPARRLVQRTVRLFRGLSSASAIQILEKVFEMR
jgi:hypothetical protein